MRSYWRSKHLGQIAIHEILVQAAVTGDRSLALQAMALDPYIRSLSQAKAILADFLEKYCRELPQFHR
jgi:alpha-galactosidase/6-phospho-beta-glucosidase family protein